MWQILGRGSFCSPTPCPLLPPPSVSSTKERPMLHSVNVLALHFGAQFCIIQQVFQILFQHQCFWKISGNWSTRTICSRIYESEIFRRLLEICWRKIIGKSWSPVCIFVIVHLISDSTCATSETFMYKFFQKLKVLREYCSDFCSCHQKFGYRYC